MGPEFLSLESLSYVASLAASAAVVLSPAVALAAGAPRAGPGRALVLGLTSKLLRSHPATDRAADALSLRAKVSTAAAYNYLVVSGPKGVGKTQLINAVLGNDFGHMTTTPFAVPTAGSVSITINLPVPNIGGTVTGQTTGTSSSGQLWCVNLNMAL